MRLHARLRIFRQMRWQDRVLLLEAAVLLGVMRIVIGVVPFRLIARFATTGPVNSPADPATLRAIHRAVTIAARNVPWRAVCLPQAMAGKAMLARRGFSSALHLGAACDKNGKLTAHAWLAAGDTIVLGGSGASRVAPLARFG